MRSVSNSFKQVIANGGPFYAYARITLQSGTILTLTSENDFFISGNKYDQSFTAAFPMGEAVCKTIDIGINNTDDKYSAHDFDGATIVLYTEAVVAENQVERISEGTFYVLESNAVGDIIEISGADAMHKADKDMPTVTYPATLREIVNAICTECGLTLGTVYFNHFDYNVTVAPKEMTCREMLGYVAQVAGGNAMINPTGRLIIKAYQSGQYSSSHIISGGKFGDELTDIISGGTFGDNTTNSVTAPELSSNTDYVVLSNYTTEPSIATDDIIITGVSASHKINGVMQTVLYGTEGYVLKIENPLIYGQLSAGVRLIGSSIVGMKVRPFSGTFSPNPTIELMDTVYVVDRKDNVYQSFVTSNTFNYLGGSEIANETKSAEQNKASYTSNASQLYRQVQEDIDNDRTNWESAVDQLTQDVENASGLFETTEADPNNPGAYIYYFHDKQTKAESQVIIAITAQALAISTDGGQTYPTGITVDGNAVVTILQSVGINADWITSGTLTVGGANNTNGIIAVKDADNLNCGVIDYNGITLSDSARLVINTNYGATAVEAGSDRIILKNSTNTKAIVNSTDKLMFNIADATKLQLEPHKCFVYTKLDVVGSADISGSLTANSIQDTNFTGTIKSGGDNTFTGSIPYIRTMQATSGGGVSWTSGTITVKNGLITGVS